MKHMHMLVVRSELKQDKGYKKVANRKNSVEFGRRMSALLA